MNYKVNHLHPDVNSLVAYYDFENVEDNQVADLQNNYPAVFKSGEAEIISNDLQLYEKEDGPTGIDEVVDAEESTLRVVAFDSGVEIISSIPQTVYIYNMSGSVVRVLQMEEESTFIGDLPKGFYVINNQKAIIR